MFLAFGGGSVTLSELEEAACKGIETKIFPEFYQIQLKKSKLEQGKTIAEICPIETKYTKEL
ncbi:MAG: hypothetical protein ACL7BU_04870 [Candidatus Phlomobacter fragariae]